MRVAPSSSSTVDTRWLPSTTASAKLFATGATLGPVVDSLHNQCLLEYHKAPIAIEWPQALQQQVHHHDGSFLFCSSWTVPPLLGFAYVVLGGILPRVVQKLVRLAPGSSSKTKDTDFSLPKQPNMDLRTRALLAVATTALIIKCSELLETHTNSSETTTTNVVLLLVAALAQWAVLDGTLAALVVASITSIGGPLSELPFVAHDFWVYLPTAGDYLPLQHNVWWDDVLIGLLGENYRQLALSSITGPCYFAVAMDAIALGRWFESTVDDDNSTAATTG